MPATDEAHFYDAMATALLGDQRALGKVRRACASWEEAYAMLADDGGVLPDPDAMAERLAAAGVSVVLSSDDNFPPRLREIPHPPHAIYVKGDPAALVSTRSGAGALAIVGTRRATPAGKSLAQRFGRELAASGFAIVSGLAFGIDGAAHDGWLAVANGTPDGTSALAVLAGGLRSVYPHSHERLAEKIIAAGGALVSEYPLSESPLARRFIERNRIVSGLSRGVVIIEAPEGSGALSTARFALEQDRDVFVVPGNVDHANYRGSNRLIRQGAELVTAPEDILESYGIVKGPDERKRAVAVRAASHGMLSPEESLVLGAIVDMLTQGTTAPDVDKISAAAKLEPRIVNQTLTFLIIKDIIKEEAGGYTLT